MKLQFITASLVALLASHTWVRAAAAQHQHGGAVGGRDTATAPLNIPMGREASGTAWQPDATPMYAVHRRAGGWQLMLHGSAFLQYLDAGSARAGENAGSQRQLGAINWFMGMARHALAGGDIVLRGMLSVEPWTVGKCGYPDLLATGELCDGRRLHDRQHPHDLFMELAAEYRRALSDGVGVSLYGGPVAEPALGPVAFPHRSAAMLDPLAPISHHWQDATHIAFGVLTAGVFGRKWKLEGSMFNGREPDEDRYDLDLGALDSYSGRIWWLPTEHVALQASIGRLTEGELDPHDGELIDVTRSTASLTYNRPVRGAGLWSSTLVWGRNDAHGQSTNAWLGEAALDLDGRNVVFGRAEAVGKSAEDLALDDAALAERVFTVGKLSLGYTRQFTAGAFLPGIGAQIALALVPADLERFYGSRRPLGFSVFASIRPAAMADDDHMHAPTPAGNGGHSRPGARAP